MKLRKVTAALLLLAVMTQLCACTGAVTQRKSALPPLDVTPVAADVTRDEFSCAAADFAAALLQQTVRDGGESVTISPYSVWTALGMTANGADGETLRQMEAVLGMSADTLNAALAAYNGEPCEELVSANSLWLRRSVDIVEEFLRTNETYYNAEVYQTDFDDKAVDAVNDWVAEHTKNRIQKLVEGFDPMTAACLINALTFDAKWQKEFPAELVEREPFYDADGTVSSVDMMYGAAEYYLSAEGVTGFAKQYEGGRFCFVGLLPDEGSSAEDYVNQLDGEKLLSLMEGQSKERVVVDMPSFKAEFSAKLSDALKAMGMPLAFDAVGADFTRMVDTNVPVYLSEVLHRTYVSVDADGTQAAAATAVEAMPGAALDENPETPKHIRLDRPFVWMIWDSQSAQPIFLGVLNSVD